MGPLCKESTVCVGSTWTHKIDGIMSQGLKFRWFRKWTTKKCCRVCYYFCFVKHDIRRVYPLLEKSAVLPSVHSLFSRKFVPLLN